MKTRTRSPGARSLCGSRRQSLLAVAVFGAWGVALADNVVPQTPEESKSPGVYQIKANALYALTPPVTGLNVTAAIIDTGIMAGHSEFTGRVLINSAFNAFDGTTNVTDGNGHGTHVAGIVGAARNGTGMFGVAYNTYLLPIKVLNDRGSGTSASVAGGIQYAVNQRLSASTADAFKPFVINLSLGSSSPSTQIANALKNAVGAGMVVAAAAGNDGGANPIYPARFAKEDWANGQIIAVGAVDANNKIASFSNRAGDAMNFYLVAPGVSIYSTYPKLDRKTKLYVEGYATLSGTSMATPYVTGAVALVKSGWGWLDAPTIANILFTSAKDLGATGVDAIYGRGLLDLQAALGPLGGLSAPISSGTTTTLDGTSLTGSGSTSTALRVAGRAGLLQVAGFDSFGRDYQVDLSPAVQRRSSTDGLASMFSALDATEEQAYSRNGAVLRLAQRSEATRLALGHRTGDAWTGNVGFAMSVLDAAGRELVFGLSGMGARAFGLAGELGRRDESLLSAALANPYFTFAEQHVHTGAGWSLGDGLRIKLGVLASAPRAQPSELAPQLSSRSQGMTLAELSGPLDAGLWSVGVGRLRETDSMLGTTQTGALSFAGQTSTNVLNLGVALPLGPRVTFGAQYSVGHTGNIANQAASLVTGYSGVRSQAFAAAISFAEAFRSGDRLSFALSQPLRVAAGTMQMVVPVGADDNGSPVLASRAISLRPDGREVRADLFYMSPINRQAKWFLGLSVRRQPDHDRSAARETLIGAGIRAAF
jgi:subtilisin family serine protease